MKSYGVFNSKKELEKFWEERKIYDKNILENRKIIEKPQKAIIRDKSLRFVHEFNAFMEKKSAK